MSLLPRLSTPDLRPPNNKERCSILSLSLSQRRKTSNNDLIKDLLIESYEGLDCFDHELLALEKGEGGTETLNDEDADAAHWQHLVEVPAHCS